MQVIYVLVCLMNLVVVSQAGDTCCGDSWLPFQGSCYFFYDEEKLDWDGAIQHCKIKNSDLVTIETRSESIFLKAYARKLFKKSSGERNTTAFWMGATDADIEGIWKWVAKDEELSYTEWDDRQPNSDPDNSEDCLALNGAYDFRWHDGKCRERIGYPLCEIKGSDNGNSVGMQIIG